MCKLPQKVILLVVLCITAPLIAGGGEKKKPAPQPVLEWPLPPNEPKVRFVRFWSGQQDFGKRSSFKEFLLGKETRKTTATLEKPYGVATDSKGNVYVCDTILGRVFVFDPSAKKLRFLGMEGPGALRKPIGITATSDDNIWVADAERRVVLRYRPDGTVAASYGEAEELQNPTSVAVDEKRGRVYVCDSHAHDVKVYDMNSTKAKSTIGERGSEEGQFNYPTNLVVDKDGFLFVVDSMNFRIQIFDAEGNFDSSFGKPGDQPGTLARPRGIAIDPQGNVFLADATHNSIQVFNQEFALLMWLGGYQGMGPGEFIQPAGLWISRDGYLYAADSLNRRVQVFKLLYLGEKAR